MTKKDPYAALRYKEFNTFLLLRFAMVFAWSMQFIVIEWQVYSITRPAFIRSYRLDGSDPRRIDGFVCRTHCRPKGKERAVAKMHFGFSVISLDFFY
jgi:hypothetical protein